MKPAWLLLVFLTLVSTQCKKDEPLKLPVLTDDGANTFGCKVSGKIFVPNGSAFGTQALSVIYVPGQNKLQINARSKYGNSTQAVNLYINGIEIRTGLNLNLQRFGTQNAATAFYSDNLDEYNIDNSLTGNLEIRRFDPVAHIISGTFNFEAINKENKKVQITDGRFDLKFT